MPPGMAQPPTGAFHLTSGASRRETLCWCARPLPDQPCASVSSREPSRTATAPHNRHPLELCPVLAGRQAHGDVICLPRHAVNTPNPPCSGNVLWYESKAPSQKTLVSFTNLPKIQTLTPLKSQITTGLCWLIQKHTKKWSCVRRLKA